MGARQVRSAAPRVRRRQHHPAEHPVATDRNPADLRTARRRVRDVYGRRTNLVLEQLCRRWADGWQGQLQRSTDRIVHSPGARPGDAEGAARLSTELAESEGSEG